MPLVCWKHNKVAEEDRCRIIGLERTPWSLPMTTETPTNDELQEQVKKLTAQARAVKIGEIEALLTDVKTTIASMG